MQNARGSQKQTPSDLKIRTDVEVKTSEHPRKAPRAHKKQTPPALKIRTDTEVKQFSILAKRQGLTKAEVQTSEHPRKTPGVTKANPTRS